MFIEKYINKGKGIYLIKLGVLLCMLFLVKASAYAQQAAPWTIEVRGTVEENDKKLEGAVVTLLANGSPVNSVTSPNGSFAFTLNGDIDYTLVFTKPGYITKRLAFSTKNVPPERSKFGFSAYNDIEVNIFPEIPGTNVDQILMQPIGKIGYDPKFHNGDFTYDQKYTESIQALLDKILEAQKEAAEKAKQLAEQYKKLIAKADNEFNAKDWTNAKADYNSALGLKPAEKYPKDQLAAIDKAIADKAAADANAAKNAALQKAIQARYDSLIRIGDAAFKSQSYASAKSAYNGAVQVKSDQQYPKDQIALCEKALADAAKKAALQAKYDSLVKIGDKAFGAKSWDNAKAAYNGALSVKSSEQYPKDQLAAIDKAIAAEADANKKAALQKKYDSLVRIGDGAFKTKKWNDAKTAYNGALQVKSDQQYPKDQLAAIDKAIADAADAAQKAALQKKYDSLVKIGDGAFKSKSWDNARAAYNGALQVKSGEQYPKDQLAAIDKAIAADADAAKKAALQKKYDSLVKIGDGAFKTKSWSDAKAAYNGALSVKSSEQYPKDQLAAIDKAIAADADAAKKATLQKKYDSLVKIGDDNFNTKSWANAKSAYNAALQVKSNEKYPKDQLAAIDKALASEADAAKKAAMEKAMQAKYDSLIKIGDNNFKTKSWANAKQAYNGALQVKPGEQYPKDQLAAIDKAIADAADAAQKAAMEKAMKAKYDSLIKVGDANFKTKSWANAKTAYNGALQVKPDQQYPKDQLALIDKALGAEADAAQKAAMAKAMQAKYDSLVKVGDKNFNSKNYDDAKTAYNGALGVKPNEKYPQDQIALCDKALADKATADADAAKRAAAAKRLQAQYDSLVKVGDKNFKTKTYDVAKDAYNGALKVKPNEQYPKDQLAAIDKALADAASEADAAKKAAIAKRLQAQYDSLVAIGDKNFKAKTYDKAKTAYIGALRVKPAEKYPQDQLKAIDDILSKQKNDDAAYTTLITNGNQAFYTRRYIDALNLFTKASNMRPDESMPKQRIAQIKKILADQQQQNDNPPPPHKDSVVADASTPDSIAAKYAQGVTEETVDEPNCQITRRVVVKGKRGWIYTRKTWNFGTYYFKAGPPDYSDVAITEDSWNQETSGSSPK